MPGELVTAATILAGSGVSTWVADKLLAPSFEALGDQFRAYAGNRVTKVLQGFQAKVKPDDVKELPPGFAIQYFQKASFSDDDEALTEMWANLLANAATKFDNRYTAFVDILSQLTSFDAMNISGLVPEDFLYHSSMSMPVNFRLEMRFALSKDMKNVSDTREEAQAEFNRLFSKDLGWPGRITSARLHFKNPDKEKGGDLSISGGSPDQFGSWNNLERLGLVERFDLDNSMTPYATAVEGILVTMLGIAFTQSCRGLLK